jgi:nuclear pore complex protein Nup188
MTGAGFLDTDPLCSTQEGPQTRPTSQAAVRDSCARYVFYYLDALSTFSQIVPAASSTGPHALYERQPERYGHPHTLTGLSYANQRQIRLPGGSILPAGSPGRLLSGDGAEFMVVCWQHTHSGWKIVLEVLTDYVNRRRMQSGVGGAYQDVSFARRSASQQMVTLRVEDVGIEMDGGGVEETVITDVLDLVRSLIQDNPAQAEQLMQALEAGEPVVSHTMSETQPPDLVQLTTMILEEALSSSSHQGNQHRTQLITSAMSVLAAILALPRYAHRVWLYVRSTAALFGTDRSVGFASVALVSERVTGRYTMTLALLNLVQQLALEAFSSILPDNPRLQQLKEEVLLRAIRFVHTEIWVEHLGWKFAQKGERFDIGRQVMTLYGDILEHSPPVLNEAAAVRSSFLSRFLALPISEDISLCAIAAGGGRSAAIQGNNFYHQPHGLLYHRRPLHPGLPLRLTAAQRREASDIFTRGPPSSCADSLEPQNKLPRQPAVSSRAVFVCPYWRRLFT